MNNQNFEHKKRGCWEQYKRENLDGEVQWQPVSRYDVFCAAFDRAYALGKHTETITQEEIEKASVEYADKTAKQYEVCNSEFVQEIMVAFEQGANFALGKQETDADTVIQGWVARDDGERWHERELHLFTRNKPERRKLMGDWMGRPSMMLDPSLFPDLTWDSEPEQVEIIIKRKKK